MWVQFSGMETRKAHTCWSLGVLIHALSDFHGPTGSTAGAAEEHTHHGDAVPKRVGAFQRMVDGWWQTMTNHSWRVGHKTVSGSILLVSIGTVKKSSASSQLACTCL